MPDNQDWFDLGSWLGEEKLEAEVWQDNYQFRMKAGINDKGESQLTVELNEKNKAGELTSIQQVNVALPDPISDLNDSNLTALQGYIERKLLKVLPWGLGLPSDWLKENSASLSKELYDQLRDDLCWNGEKGRWTQENGFYPLEDHIGVIDTIETDKNIFRLDVYRRVEGAPIIYTTTVYDKDPLKQTYTSREFSDFESLKNELISQGYLPPVHDLEIQAITLAERVNQVSEFRKNLIDVDTGLPYATIHSPLTVCKDAIANYR